MNRTFLIFCFFACLLHANLFSQRPELGIGMWRDHLPYIRANSVSLAGDVIYCGSEAALIAYDFNSKEVQRLTTIEGLSDIGIQIVKYSDYTNTLLIAYKNGNIDLLKPNGIRNISAIHSSNVIGDKSIYNIRFDQNLAYLSTGFGIVVLNLVKEEISETYYISGTGTSLKVNDTYLDHTQNIIYAATANGMYQAALDDNLSDFNSWIKTGNVPNGEYTLVDYFMDTLLFNLRTNKFDSDIVYGMHDDEVKIMNRYSGGGINDFEVSSESLIITKNYNISKFSLNSQLPEVLYSYGDGLGGPNSAQAIFDKKRNAYWVADRQKGLVEAYIVGNTKFIAPNGPNTLNTNNIDIKHGLVWTSSGLHDDGYRAAENHAAFNRYAGNTWTGSSTEDTEALDSMYGFVKIEIDPVNPSIVYSGSWDQGLLEIHDEKTFVKYDLTNKVGTGHTLSPVFGTQQIKVGGLAFDREGNLWVTNSETPNALSVKTPDGKWYGYNLGPYISEKSIVGDLVITDQGHKWIIINRDSDADRIVVFKDNGTLDKYSDDSVAVLSTQDGLGGIPGSLLHCIAIDRSGAIWIGTNEGPAVFYSPSSVFDKQMEAQRVFVEQDGLTQILLETENVKTIAVDGANRKWFGTTGSGAYLMSEDGTRQEAHFTEKNSPLFKDEINDIEINQENGEVFFSTSSGLISFKGTATDGSSGFGSVQVYPNPVGPGYGGLIAVKGLAQNANVKITDVNGILIYETKASGGQAIWNGYSLDGRKATNGVYLIFCTDQEGESQEVTKVLYFDN